MGNFTISDLIATSEAFLLFIFVVFIPGYVGGWLLNLLDFRRRSLAARCAMAVPFSIGLCPIVTYLLWRVSLNAVWFFYGSCALGFLAMVVADRALWFRRPQLSRTRKIILAVVAGWVVLGTLLLVDLQIGDRLYFPSVAYDYTLRSAFTSAITRTGIPPQNPYFFPGRPFVMRYHYFWLILCSVVQQLGGGSLSARQAMLGGTLWAGIGLMSTIPLYLRFFQPKGAAHLDRRTLIGIGLLMITGLDIIPVSYLVLAWGRLLISIDWWNTAVPAWAYSMLWVPHQVASLIACLTGVLLCFWSRDHTPHVRMAAGLAAGLMFASGAGLSIYVTVVFAVFVAVWVVILAVTKHSSQALAFCAAGLVSAIAAIPYLLELKGTESGQSIGPGSILVLTVRSFYFAEALATAIWPHQPLAIVAANAAALPLNYFIEFGFFSAAGILQCRRMLRRGTSRAWPDVCLLAMGATSLVLSTFLRSSVISNNDFGWRAVLIGQFVLLIWAAELWDDGAIASWRARKPVVVTSLLVLGIAGTVYELTMVRFYPPLSDSMANSVPPWKPSDHDLGRRTYALRQIYEQLRTALPEGAVVQQNPNATPDDLPYGLYADRQTAAETPACGVVFGGSPALCSALIPQMRSLFDAGSIEVAGVDPICKGLSVDALVVKDSDGVWLDKNSWVWQKRPVFANNRAKAFACEPAPERVSSYRPTY